VINRYVGNLPPMPGVFPDYPAPVRRTDPAAPRAHRRHHPDMLQGTNTHSMAER
jgi:hypothetical protein